MKITLTIPNGNGIYLSDWADGDIQALLKESLGNDIIIFLQFIEVKVKNLPSNHLLGHCPAN
jgi:hypothetical protein